LDLEIFDKLLIEPANTETANSIFDITKNILAAMFVRLPKFLHLANLKISQENLGQSKAFMTKKLER